MRPILQFVHEQLVNSPFKERVHKVLNVLLKKIKERIIRKFTYLFAHLYEVLKYSDLIH